MKKHILKAALICTVSVLGMSAECATIDKIYTESNRVFVEGKTDSFSKVYPITVIKKGTDLEKLKEEKPQVFYQGEIISDNEGKTALSFKMPNISESSTYIIRVSNGKNIENYEFSYFSSADRKPLLDKINSGNISDIRDVLTNKAEILGLTLGKEARIELSGVANRIYRKVTETPDYAVNPVFTEEALVEFYKEAVVLEAFYQGKINFLLKDGVLQYNEYTKINEKPIYTEYNDNLSKSGIDYVNNSVLSAKCASKEDIAKAFEKYTAYAVLSHYKTDGYGHVNRKIYQYREIYENQFGIDLTNYDLLNASQKTVFARELNIKSITDADKLKEKVESTAKAVLKQTSQNNGAGGGTGGGGGGAGGAGGSANSEVPKIDVSIPVAPVTEKTAFSDLKSVEWAKESIEYLKEKNIINGKGDGKFYPNDNITRVEFAKIICLAFNISTKGAESDFGDVNKNEWYYPYVSALYNSGVITGVGENNFGVDENITREQMAVIIARMSDAKPSSYAEFDDDYMISDYAKDAVYAMRELGVINGSGDNNFNPKGIATRAEAAKIVYGAINKFLK